MPALDARGIIAAVQIALYVLIAVVAGALVARFALRRDAGWLFLFVLALTRVTDGALIAAGESAKTKSDLFTPAYTLQAAGLAPLMLASLGFIGLVGQRTFSDYPRFSYVLRILSMVVVAAAIFAIAGGLLGSPVAPKHGSAGLALRRMGACVFALSFVLIAFAHFGALTYRWHIRAHRRQLLMTLFFGLAVFGSSFSVCRASGMVLLGPLRT